MKRLSIITALTAALLGASNNPFAGRWNITVTTPKATYPSWMEVAGDQVRVQQRTGNVRPAAGSTRDGSRLIVTVAAATPERPELVWELTAKGGKLTGVQKRGASVEGQLAAVRAPALKRPAPKAWTEPEPLFNGKDLTGWEPVNNTPGIEGFGSHWAAKDGELVNEAKGSNLRTTRTFEDFKLNIEYNVAERANSGVYLRGRYEVQVAAGRGGPNSLGGAGSVYGFLAPAVEVPARPGEWQRYEITLVGRNVTVVLNGATLIDNQEIPGITGGALDSNEAEPGPIYLQGDHSGGIRFRNIAISVPKR